MKKKLQKILVLALGLTTTIASAQFSANSVTRIDNTNSDDKHATNRITLSADMGAVHVSYDVAYSESLGRDMFFVPNANDDWYHEEGLYQKVYEAYVSTDLMGFGTLTIGRKDLSFGSGALISSNDWGMLRHTQDGISLDANLGGFEVSLGTMGGVQYDNSNYMNASGNFGGADINILMMTHYDRKAHGYDLSYSMNNFTISASMNSDFEGDEMTSYGLTYNVTDHLSASFGRTSYGDAEYSNSYNTESGLFEYFTKGFDMDNTSMSHYTYNSNGLGENWGLVEVEPWSNGNIGYLHANDENTSMGVSYDLGDITLSYTMHTISNDDTWDGSEDSFDSSGAAIGDDITPDDREATSMSLSYQLNDNCSLSLSRFSDTSLEHDAYMNLSGEHVDADDGERTYLTIYIGL